MRIMIGLGLLAMGAAASAQVYVAPHVNRDGTYVQGHMRTAPNNTTLDNWSTRPNVNPYTGKQGTRDPNPTPRTTTPSYPTYRPYHSPLPAQPQFNGSGRIF